MYEQTLLKSLAAELHRLVNTGQVLEAGMQAWFSLVWRAPHIYEAMSAKVSQPDCSEFESKCKTGEIVFLEWPVTRYLEHLNDQPLLLVAGLLAAGNLQVDIADGSPSISESRFVYGGDVSKAAVKTFDSENSKDLVYAVKSRRSPTDYQFGSHQRFTGFFSLAVSKQPFGDFRIGDHLSRKSRSGLQEALASQGYLRVMCAEFQTLPIFQDKFLDQAKRLWQADGLENADEICREAEQILEKAKSECVNVLIFPELCVPDIVKDTIKSWLLTNNEKNLDRGRLHTISLVVAGSFHTKISDADIRNTATVLNAAGNEIKALEHEKLHPVSLAHVGESISPGRTIQASTTPIGPIGVLICLDLAQTQPLVRTEIGLLPVSIWLVPSLSKKVEAHKTEAKKFLTHAYGIVAVANQGPCQIAGSLTFGESVSENDWWRPNQSFVIYRNPGMLKPVTLDQSQRTLNKGNPYLIFDVPLALPSVAKATDTQDIVT